MTQSQIPNHVAIIMDGNGRWAKDRGMNRIEGHREGMKRVKEIVKGSSELGIKVLTLYAFSTENWSRPSQEVQFLMSLPERFLIKELNNLIEENVKVNRIGFDERVPKNTLSAFDKAAEKTKDNTGLILNFAFNYGSRAEIVHMVKEIAALAQEKKISPEEIDEKLISEHLLTKNLPDPDLLIRTSGEIRISNFLLWQIAYSEMIFTDVYFPDFTKDELVKCVDEYARRNRRFGKV